MKNLVTVLAIFLSLHCFSQNNIEENTYLIFDNSSDKTYSYEIGDGKIGRAKVYTKTESKKGIINFYIAKENFVSNKKQVDTCTINYLKKIKISTIEDLKNDVAKKNPLNPFKVFPNLYLIEKMDDSRIIKYKVKWQYYIE